MARDFSSKNVIVGAGQLLIGPSGSLQTTLPTLVNKTKTAQNPENISGAISGNQWYPVGYTQDGATLSIEPTYGEVAVDQLLDAARIFKTGTTARLTTNLAEATLENLLIVLSGVSGDFYSGYAAASLVTPYQGAAGTASFINNPSYFGQSGSTVEMYPASLSLTDVLAGPIDSAGGISNVYSASAQKFSAFGGGITGYTITASGTDAQAGRILSASFRGATAATSSLVIAFQTGTKLNQSPYILNAWQRITLAGASAQTADTLLTAASFNQTYLVASVSTSASTASLVSLSNTTFNVGAAQSGSAIITSASLTWQDPTVELQIAEALNINGGALGAFPVERSICLVGPGPTVAVGKNSDRFYVGYRATSMESTNIAVKRDEATMFPVTFRLMPFDGQGGADGNATYGRVVDRIY